MTSIRLERADGIGAIVFDRPEAANAIDMAFADGLAEAATEVTEDPSVRAVLLRAIGKHFSVGGDLKDFAGLGDRVTPALRQLANRLHDAVLLLARLEVPLVVAIQGNAAGAGMSLALLGDVALAARSARFRVAYTAVGLTPDGGGSWMLPRLVGPRVAAELALSNRVVDADEAQRLGLVSRLVDDDELQAEAETLTRDLAKGAMGAYATTKRLLAVSATSTLEDHLVEEAIAISTAAGTPEGQEGIGAFMEKRTPKFR